MAAQATLIKPTLTKQDRDHLQILGFIQYLKKNPGAVNNPGWTLVSVPVEIAWHGEKRPPVNVIVNKFIALHLIEQRLRNTPTQVMDREYYTHSRENFMKNPHKFLEAFAKGLKNPANEISHMFSPEAFPFEHPLMSDRAYDSQTQIEKMATTRFQEEASIGLIATEKKLLSEKHSTAHETTATTENPTNSHSSTVPSSSQDNGSGTQDHPSVIMVASPDRTNEKFSVKRLRQEVRRVKLPRSEQVKYIRREARFRVNMAGIRSYPTVRRFGLGTARKGWREANRGISSIQTGTTPVQRPISEFGDSSSSQADTPAAKASVGSLGSLLSALGTIPKMAFIFGRFGTLPVILVIVLIAIVGIFLFMTLFKSTTAYCNVTGPCGPGGGGGESGGAVLPITVTKLGEPNVDNRDEIHYNITIGYNGLGSADVQIVDLLPGHSNYKDSSLGGSYSDTARTVTWNLTGISTNTPKVVLLTVTTTAADDDQWLTNNAKVTITHLNTPTIAGDGEFEALMRGQGRNTGVLGSLDQFLATVLKNAGRAWGLDNKIAYLTKIYNQSVSANVNPLIVLTLWGEESGFTTTGKFPFGCDPYLERFNYFDANLGCSIRTISNRMNDFERDKDSSGIAKLPKLKKVGNEWVPSGEYCTFNDATIYMFEVYGPRCTKYDGNEHFESNFVAKYKQLLGQ